MFVVALVSHLKVAYCCGRDLIITEINNKLYCEYSQLDIVFIILPFYKF